MGVISKRSIFSQVQEEKDKQNKGKKNPCRKGVAIQVSNQTRKKQVGNWHTDKSCQLNHVRTGKMFNDHTGAAYHLPCKKEFLSTHCGNTTRYKPCPPEAYCKRPVCEFASVPDSGCNDRNSSRFTGGPFQVGPVRLGNRTTFCL